MRLNILSALILGVLLFQVNCERTRRAHGGYHRGQGNNWRTPAAVQSQFQDLGQGFGRNEAPWVEKQLVDEDAGDIQQSQIEDLDGITFPPMKQAQRPTPETKAGQQPIKYQEGQPEAKTDKGTFIGKVVKIASTNKNVIAFLGIPFAKAPMGGLRFKAPVPSDKLETPYYATELPNACFQESPNLFPGFSGEEMWKPNTNISEDCLYLNIWVPEDVFKQKEAELVPVLNWIFGGGFFSGSNSLDIYNGAMLASTEDVIVVSANYRLGPQGFLYFGTEDAPGNMGLLDQSLALRWIHDHISNFGGDANLVTLFGESGGSASVGYHLLSPMSKIYFKRAVLMSGLPSQSYSFIHPNVIRNRSYKLAKFAGCDVQKPPQEILDCLRNVEPAVITRLQWRFVKKMLTFPFIPTIDGKFLTDFPSHLISNGDAKRAEVIVGSVKNEGSYFILYQYLKYFHNDKSTSVTRERFVDIMKEIFGDYSENELDAIISYYTNWENPEDGLLNQQRISEAVGDAWFICPNKKFADAWSNRGLKVFYYHLTQKPSTSEWGEWMGTNHADDINFWFGHPLNDTNKSTPKEGELSLYMMSMLANFSRVGAPSNKWERYTTEMPVYLDLNATKISDETCETNLGPRGNACAFWNRILPKMDKRKRKRNTHWRQQKGGQGGQRNWNQMNTMPMGLPNQNQEGFDEHLPNQMPPYPEMGWTHPSHPHNLNPHHGVHGGQGFHINTMAQQQQQPHFCIVQPTSGFGSSSTEVPGPTPMPEQIKPGVSSPSLAVPKDFGGKQQPYLGGGSSCSSCCSNSIPIPPSNYNNMANMGYNHNGFEEEEMEDEFYGQTPF